MRETVGPKPRLCINIYVNACKTVKKFFIVERFQLNEGILTFIVFEESDEKQS